MLLDKVRDLDKAPYARIKGSLQILIRIITCKLKRSRSNEQQIILNCEKLASTIEYLESVEPDTHVPLTNNNCWAQFTRFCLQYGLAEGSSDRMREALLKVLSKTVQISYVDQRNDEYVKTLFEMTTSHSKFFKVLLKTSPIKSNVLSI